MPNTEQNPNTDASPSHNARPGIPTQVFLVSGKKARRAYQKEVERLQALHREDATLSDITETSEANVQKEHTQRNVGEEAR